MAAAVGNGNVEFIRARSDKREYRRVVLPNALECLLISDAETDKAAACMEVEVGSFSDPEGLEGLAHFLEHMLFYASEKYPEEHEFAQFFIKPLMSQDAVLREIKAVDSEHKKNLLSDGWRISQLQKHLASKDHPYHKFSTGSWETLETKPKEQGLDIRLELLKFYENYSANLMHLVVYGKESLDCIQSMVERLFSDIKSSGQKSFKCPSDPLSEEHLQILVKTLPIEEGWAMNLGAGEGSDSTQYSFFSVSMRLTDAGHENGVHEWIFNELFPPEEWLVGASLPSKFTPERINMILDELSPERVRIFWESKKFEGHTNSVEPWYSTSYSVENVTPSMIQQWIQNAPTEKLHLPKPNIFIPKDLSLKEVHEKVWVGGYNDKMRVLLNAILKQISNFEVKPSRFSALKVHQEDAISNVKLELFSLIASQPAFNQLRTIEQLGYIASLSLRYDYGVWALHVVIQSTVKDPSYLDTRVDEFFKMFEINIHELSDKDFKRNVKSLIDSKLEKFKNLWEESHFYWGEIEAGTLKFDRVESEVALLRELKKEEFIEFFDQYIKVGAPQRRTISVQVFGCNHSEEFKTAIAEADPPKTYRITDIFGFKRSRPLYSSLKGGPGRITMD
ncbi:hypothetical protein PR202_ga09456 [Eleusine coracana subsp. coracana]|uniref:Uncharacterized protein n=1 Tax=Eleusine coracana subsp. coracana TaxID=191504 RepID=A0AAV5C413_ELECO|nr:hypothetical protein PR202_ga09456 [Eleusine coracana subsp. coracana]